MPELGGDTNPWRRIIQLSKFNSRQTTTPIGMGFFPRGHITYEEGCYVIKFQFGEKNSEHIFQCQHTSPEVDILDLGKAKGGLDNSD